MEERIAKAVIPLVHAQLGLALGRSVLFRKGNPPEQVKSAAELRRYMRGEVDQKLYEEIETTKPNEAAIEDLLNRIFGTPRQTIDMPDHPYRPLFALPGTRLVAMGPVEPEGKGD